MEFKIPAISMQKLALEVEHKQRTNKGRGTALNGIQNTYVSALGWRAISIQKLALEFDHKQRINKGRGT